MFSRATRGVDSGARIVSKIDVEITSAVEASGTFAGSGAHNGLAVSGIKGFINSSDKYYPEADE